MSKVLRKTITVKHKDKIVYCLTYNLIDKIVADDLQYWIDEKEQNNFTYLYRLQQMIVGIKAHNKNNILEKTIFDQLKNVDKYLLDIEQFNTKAIANSMKPYRNCVSITEKEIDEKIENYIKG